MLPINRHLIDYSIYYYNYDDQSFANQPVREIFKALGKTYNLRDNY